MSASLWLAPNVANTTDLDTIGHRSSRVLNGDNILHRGLGGVVAKRVEAQSGKETRPAHLRCELHCCIDKVDLGSIAINISQTNIVPASKLQSEVNLGGR